MTYAQHVKAGQDVPRRSGTASTGMIVLFRWHCWKFGINHLSVHTDCNAEGIVPMVKP